MDDLSNIFDEAERYLRAALSRWQKQLPDMYEDAFQEGMIQCWRDVEAGETIKLKILRRASMSANKFFHRNGEYYFGKPRKSRDGLRTNAKTVEKIQVYLTEVMPLRDNVWPTPIEVSNAIGIPYSAASKILKDIREGRVDHMVYREDGRMDWDYYKTFSVETLGSTNEEGNASRHWTDDMRFAASFEDDTASSMDMESLLRQLNTKHRSVLYMYLYQGMSANEIGKHYGHTTNLSAKGARHISNAVNQARMIVHPYEGECTNGHARDTSNTKVSKREDGVYFRTCTICKVSNAEKTNAKQKATGFKTGRKEKAYCPQNHLKDVRDSRGALRCSKCRSKAQRDYTARQRENLRARNEGS